MKKTLLIFLILSASVFSAAPQILNFTVVSDSFHIVGKKVSYQNVQIIQVYTDKSPNLTGFPVPAFQWRKNGDPFSASSNLSFFAGLSRFRTFPFASFNDLFSMFDQRAIPFQMPVAFCGEII